MMRVTEAQEVFHRAPTIEAARAYHRIAWRAYLANELTDSEFNEIMQELELWISPPVGDHVH